VTALLGRPPAPARLVALDPGSPDLGIADYQDGVMVAAHHIQVPRPADARCPACWKPCRHGIEPALIVALCDEVERVLDVERKLPTVVLSEHPQIFQVQKGDDGQGGSFERGGRALFLMCAVMAALLDRAAAWGAACYQYTPAVWKGVKRKDEHQRQALTYFTAAEIQRLPRSARAKYFVSDALDAAALGMWWLSRAKFRELHMHRQAQELAPWVEPVRSGSRANRKPRTQAARWMHR